ncbi:MAG: sulfurtransferase TusA family protein [Methylococcales bacterium]|jgi:tRNA 2-thiouridine synthesizing protein A|nr:sulfurtransferase TusA family protein [Methylococcales bacterium]
MLNFDTELNTNGLNCPLPILRAKKAIKTMEKEQVLRVTATDPGSLKDMEAFCKQTGNELIESENQANEYVFYIRKS